VAGGLPGGDAGDGGVDMNEWISVEDRLPKSGQLVIAAWLHFATGSRTVDNSYMKSSIHYGGYWRVREDEDLNELQTGWKVTHWMPLPKPPNE